MVATLGIADHAGPRYRGVSLFKVLATEENQQQQNEQNIGFHYSPFYGAVASTQPALAPGSASAQLKERTGASVAPKGWLDGRSYIAVERAGSNGDG